MELSESIDTINVSLLNMFGMTIDGNPIFRVVFSEDQFEKRLMNTTDEGLQLLTPQARLVPKYRQWIKEKYVLERLVVVPDVSVKELADNKVSYEPVWVFEDKDGNYLPPRTDACKYIIDCLYAALGKKSLRKYVDDEEKNPVEMREQRIKGLEQELFGNETNTTDALAHGQGIVVPRSYES